MAYKPNLADKPTPEAVRKFVSALVGLAWQDFRQGRKQYSRTGQELVDLCAGSHRGFHVGMASSIWNKSLWTFQSGYAD